MATERVTFRPLRRRNRHHEFIAASLSHGDCGDKRLEWTASGYGISQSQESLVDVHKLCAESRETLSHVGWLELSDHAVNDRHDDGRAQDITAERTEDRIF